MKGSETSVIHEPIFRQFLLETVASQCVQEVYEGKLMHSLSHGVQWVIKTPFFSNIYLFSNGPMCIHML